MSEAGLYLSDPDKLIVKCPWCEVEIDSWCDTDIPFNRHANASPSCSYINPYLSSNFAIIKFSGVKLGNTKYAIKSLHIVEGESGNFNSWDFTSNEFDSKEVEGIIRDTVRKYAKIMSYGKEQCKYLGSVLKCNVFNIEEFGFPVKAVHVREFNRWIHKLKQRNK